MKCIFKLFLIFMSSALILSAADPFLPKINVKEFQVIDLERDDSKYILTWKLLATNKESGTKPAVYRIVPLDRFGKEAKQWSSRDWFAEGEIEVRRYRDRSFEGTIELPVKGIENETIQGIGIMFTSRGGLSRYDKEYSEMTITSIYGDPVYGKLNQ